MKKPIRLRSLLILPVVGLMLVTLASPGSSREAAAPASLSVSPRADYVGGQAITFTGTLGASGQRTIKIQSNMGRPGDTWEPVDGFTGRTEPDGSFEFVFRAPGMFGISYRVVSGSLKTNGVKFEALSQDLTLEPLSPPVAGEPFDIEIDTTPSLYRRPSTIGLQPILGRVLTLQRRVDGDTWQKVGETTVDRNGLGVVTVSESEPGMYVYRARQEDWTRNGNQIGWFPSFPTYIEVFATEDEASLPPAPDQQSCSQVVVGDSATATAAGTHKWGASLFDFAWVAGESLTSKPYRGTKKRGKWIDYTDGGGRVNKNNGGLMLDSKRVNGCAGGDFGTTRATLTGNAQTYGRWEVRLRLKSDEKSARDYRTLVELVPQKAGAYKCGARNVTIAEMLPHSSTVKFGVNAMNKQWSGQKSVGDQVNNRSLVFAVEVSKTHMSWFYAGKVIGTVKSRAASSDVPMTLRLSMEGSGNQEMNHTELISDWQRGFTLARGTQTKNGKALKRSSYSAPAC